MTEEVFALKPRTCRKCGIEKLELDFTKTSKDCKTCIKAYNAKRRIKSIGVIGFSDFKQKAPIGQEGTKQDQGKHRK